MKSIQLKKLTLDPDATQKRLNDGLCEAAAIIEAMRQRGVTVRLFGSRNTGKAFPNSDIDLLVTDCGPISPEQVLVEIHAMEKGIPLDVVLLEFVPEGSLQRVMESLNPNCRAIMPVTLPSTKGSLKLSTRLK